MSPRFSSILAAGLLACTFATPAFADDAQTRAVIDAAIEPVMAQYKIPGMAVAVTIDGTRTFAEYGLASKSPQEPVTRDTLFELGSVSKTFTATLASEAEIEGKLSLNDAVGKYLPALKGTPIADVRLLGLGTHTAGGFPLQLPATVTNQQQLTAYLRAWKTRFAAGTMRTYANPSIGLLGVITAKAMGADFKSLAANLFRDLGLQRTYIDIPPAEMKSYAWGYKAADDKPIHVAPGMLATEAYGVKSNTTDMIRFLEVNMGIGAAPPPELARAVQATHTGYYRAGELIQDLIWEEYPYPVALEKIVAGNAPAMVIGAKPATAIVPPMPPREDAILNKTGSTNGFGTYVAFVPEKKIGIVILANKYYPNEARVKAAQQILSRLTE